MAQLDLGARSWVHIGSADKIKVGIC